MKTRLNIKYIRGTFIYCFEYYLFILGDQISLSQQLVDDEFTARGIEVDERAEFSNLRDSKLNRKG